MRLSAKSFLACVEHTVQRLWHSDPLRRVERKSIVFRIHEIRKERTELLGVGRSVWAGVSERTRRGSLLQRCLLPLFITGVVAPRATKHGNSSLHLICQAQLLHRVALGLAIANSAPLTLHRSPLHLNTG